MKFDGDVRVIHENIKTGRILVTSDIHGDLDGFKVLLEKMEYTPVIDTLVIIGDLVQKGTQNLGTVRCIMELAKAHNVFVLLGNNDLFTLVDTDRNIFNHFKHHFGRTVLYESAAALGLPLRRHHRRSARRARGRGSVRSARVFRPSSRQKRPRNSGILFQMSVNRAHL